MVESTHRSRLAGEGFKPPKGALVKSHGIERLGKVYSMRGFFDNISHEKLMKAVHKHVPENWACMYIQRWLNMPVQTKTGELIAKQGKGTPQGGVINPLLANLFLHYAFDKWLELHATTVKYVVMPMMLLFTVRAKLTQKEY